jgi:hypothetical protein
MSTVAVDTITKADGTQGVSSGSFVKTWIHYTQATPVVDASLNVSSATDTAAGVFTVNYTNNKATTTHPKCAMGGTSSDATTISFTTENVASTVHLSEDDAGTNLDIISTILYFGDYA